MELAITQKEADQLIQLVKNFCKQYHLDVKDNERYTLNVKAKKSNRKFKIFIQYATENYHINFWDEKTKLSLVRLNLNDSFHKNANGERIHGPRVNLFCEDEFNQRDDGQYMRAYSLPHKDNKGILNNPSSFSDALEEMLKYIKVIDYKDKLTFSTKLL